MKQQRPTNETNKYYLDLTYDQYLKNGKQISNTNLGKYYIYEKIDKGAFGTVYRGMDGQTKKQVAIKLIDLASIEKQQKNQRVREIRRRLAKTQSEMMSLIDSSHVMKLYDVYQNKWLKIMVIEYCNQGTLNQNIYRRGRIPQKQAIQILKQLILGVSSMHQLNIIHRDLKSQNIMSNNGIYKIVDLGFAKLLPSNSQVYNGTVLGTIITMAPQVMKKQKYGVKADIWSLGIILYEMIYGIPPYEPMKAPDMYDQIISKDIFPNQGKINGYQPSQEVLNLMKNILVINQEQRMSWQQLINQQIFKNNKQNLADEYRVTVDIAHLSTKQNKVQPITEQQLFQILEKKGQQDSDIEPIKSKKSAKVQKVDQQFMQQKKQEVDKSQENIVEEAKQFYLDCQKTQFILKQIIQHAEQRSVFAKRDRRVTQLFYLMSSRCFCNMSFVRDRIGSNENELIKNLKENVNQLYKSVVTKHNFYSKQLFQKQNKIKAIVSDRFEKTFFGSVRKQKDQFLQGNQITEQMAKNQQEKAGYTRREQVEYTYDKFILPTLRQDTSYSNPVAWQQRALLSYRQINFIKQEDLAKIKFKDLTRKIKAKQVLAKPQKKTEAQKKLNEMEKKLDKATGGLLNKF